MKKRRQKSATRKKTAREFVLAFDIGGTKVLCGVVDSRGRVVEETLEPVAIPQGKKAFLAQLERLGRGFLQRHRGIRKIGVASAGPLEPELGVLLDPTNFVSDGKTWGRFPLARLVSEKLGLPVTLENDAAAAALAEHWVGAGRGVDDLMILTLGTGLGTGIIAQGKLVRAGRGLHPEAGHIILKHGDETAPCGCGNLGCSEAYLSGRSFTRRARARFGNPELDAKAIAELARRRDPRALAAFEEYATLLAVAIHNYAVIFCPRLVVLTGSFAQASDLFLDATRSHLEILMARRRVGVDLLPKVAISSLGGNAGLIGGAYVALHPHKP